jgi:hypothetical protein
MDNITNSLHTLHMPGMASCWKTLNETHHNAKKPFQNKRNNAWVAEIVDYHC